MPMFALCYRNRRRKPKKPGEAEQDDFELFTARTRQAALIVGRRWQIANLRRGYRCRLPEIGAVVMLEMGPPPPPEVGIFWQVWNRTYPALITDRVPVDEAEAYGDFQTHGAHAEYWEKLASMSPRALREEGLPGVILTTEYDQWPRGRVVFNRETGRFTLYADPKLQAPSTIETITAHFHLPTDRVDVRSDAHYVSVR
jgi:hypothetical protein